MDHILALDQGTTSSRAIVFSRDGLPVAVAQRELRQHYPRPGWVEHDPREILEGQLAVAREALARSPGPVAALGITNQRETTLLWDRRTGEPLHPSIVWQDRRTAGLCDRLKSDGLEPLFRERTGLVLDPYFSGTKLAWLLEHIPGARERAEEGELAFGTVDSWLIWHLTGGRVHATDVTNAARTLLLNVRTLGWDPDLLAALGVPPAVLPEVRPSSAMYGEADLLDGLSIGGVAGDQHAALFGQACLSRGMVKNTYGTGCFMLLNTGPEPVESAHGLLTTPAWALPRPTYALEGSVFVAGALVQWLRDELGLIGSAAEIEALAASAPDSGGVHIVPAFAGLGAPHWDPYARGAILGLTRGSGRAQIARAALEAIAYQTRDVLEAMVLDSSSPIVELRADGGAAANDLLMQFQADILGVGVARPRVTETTALGAAYLASLGVGLLELEEVGSNWALERRFEPRMDEAEREERYGGWRRAVERAKGWLEG